MNERKQAIDKLGQRLMAEVRDYAISGMDLILDGSAKAPRDVNLHRQIASEFDESQLKLAKFLLMHAIDLSLHYMMWTLEHERGLRLLIESPDGTTVDAAEASDGLAGELYGPEGWIKKFSKYESTE